MGDIAGSYWSFWMYFDEYDNNCRRCTLASTIFVQNIRVKSVQKLSRNMLRTAGEKQGTRRSEYEAHRKGERPPHKLEKQRGYCLESSTVKSNLASASNCTFCVKQAFRKLDYIPSTTMKVLEKIFSLEILFVHKIIQIICQSILGKYMTHKICDVICSFSE